MVGNRRCSKSVRREQEQLGPYSICKAVLLDSGKAVLVLTKRDAAVILSSEVLPKITKVTANKTGGLILLYG